MIDMLMQPFPHPTFLVLIVIVYAAFVTWKCMQLNNELHNMSRYVVEAQRRAEGFRQEIVRLQLAQIKNQVPFSPPPKNFAPPANTPRKLRVRK